MQQAVLYHFPDAQAIYRFTHRDKDVYFTRKCIEEFKTAISRTSFIDTSMLTSSLCRPVNLQNSRLCLSLKLSFNGYSTLAPIFSRVTSNTYPNTGSNLSKFASASFLSPMMASRATSRLKPPVHGSKLSCGRSLSWLA